MGEVFLIGGGWQGLGETFGRFVKATSAAGRRRIALILLDEDESIKGEVEEKYRWAFSEVGISSRELDLLWISPGKPFQAGKLEDISPTGIFVGGGATPLYQEVLCRDGSLSDYIRGRGIPYGGFSAGAAIAAECAVVGGWKIREAEREIAVVDRECSEDLEWLTVTDGLGLVPFSVEVHASQWGNLARLIHVVDQRLVEGGWAIDEDTMMEVDDSSIRVRGAGQVYHVERAGPGRVRLGILRSGENCSF